MVGDSCKRNKIMGSFKLEYSCVEFAYERGLCLWWLVGVGGLGMWPGCQAGGSL